MSYLSPGDEGGFVILAQNRVVYSTREVPVKSQKSISVGKVRASAKNKREVIFPIFDKMMQIEEDPYWKFLFDEAATGKFPRNFKFQNGVLNYKIRSKTEEQALNLEDVTESILVAKRFFLDKAGLQSAEDRHQKKLEEEKRISEMIMNEVISWSQIRSEKQRMIMISLYVETIGKEHGLTVEERKGLVQNIRIGMLGGYFNSDNIKIIGNRITEIEGLEFIEETKEFRINKEICKPSKIPKKPTVDYTDNTLTLDEEESPDSYLSDEESGSLHSSQSLKKRWKRFLSDISKK